MDELLAQYGATLGPIAGAVALTKGIRIALGWVDSDGTPANQRLSVLTAALVSTACVLLIDLALGSLAPKLLPLQIVLTALGAMGTHGGVKALQGR